MNATRKIIYLALPAVWCAVPTVSFADKCAGTNINNLISWEPTEIVKGTTLNTVRLAVRAELVEAHSPFDRLSPNELKRTALGPHWQP